MTSHNYTVWQYHYNYQYNYTVCTVTSSPWVPEAKVMDLNGVSKIHLFVVWCTWVPPSATIISSTAYIFSTRARFLSLAQSKLRLCSANHRPGYWCNLPCDWPSTVWAYSKQETENGCRSLLSNPISLSGLCQVKHNWAHFLSLAQSKLRLCSANHRPGY